MLNYCPEKPPVWMIRHRLAVQPCITSVYLPVPPTQPTNHLDLEACVWLEEYLKDYKKCLILISHSQVRSRM